MNPALLRKILMWTAPILVGYIMKKYETRHAKKQQENGLAKN